MRQQQQRRQQRHGAAAGAVQRRKGGPPATRWMRCMWCWVLLSTAVAGGLALVSLFVLPHHDAMLVMLEREETTGGVGGTARHRLRPQQASKALRLHDLLEHQQQQVQQERRRATRQPDEERHQMVAPADIAAQPKSSVTQQRKEALLREGFSHIRHVEKQNASSSSEFAHLPHIPHRPLVDRAAAAAILAPPGQTQRAPPPPDRPQPLPPPRPEQPQPHAHQRPPESGGLTKVEVSLPEDPRTVQPRVIHEPLPIAASAVKPASAFPVCEQFPRACECPVQDPPMLIYNRVPKCASGTMQVFFEFAKRNTNSHIVFCRNTGYMSRYMAPGQWNVFEKNPLKVGCSMQFNKMERPIINMHKFYKSLPNPEGVPQGRRPQYINVVREPLDRIRSLFYFERDSFGQFPKTQTIDECYRDEKVCPMAQEAVFASITKPQALGKNRFMDSRLGNRRATFELEGSTNYLTYWFCGMNETCGRQDESILEEAKRVMAQEYALVGLQDRLNDTFFVMQTMFPNWFGVWGTVLPKEGEPCNKCGHAPWPELEAETRAKLEQIFFMDLPLYKFAQEVFDAKFHACMRTALSGAFTFASPALARRGAQPRQTARQAAGSDAAKVVRPPGERHWLERVEAVEAAAQEAPAAIAPQPATALLSLNVHEIQPASAFAICKTYPSACRCPVRDPARLIYNRVPKCASGSMQVFMELASMDNKQHPPIRFCRGQKFTMRYPTPDTWRLLQTEPTRAVCDKTFSRDDRVLMNWHMVHVDTQAGMGGKSRMQPVYFNVVREPIARIESRFYYDRDTWEMHDANATLDHCLASETTCKFANQDELEKRSKPWYIRPVLFRAGTRTDTFNMEAGTNYMTHWFCGANKSCSVNDWSTFHEAKRIMAEEYAFIGLQSRLNDTFFIMQTMFPAWFGPWGSVLGTHDMPCNKCGHAPPPPLSAAGRRILERLYWMDIPLYRFAEELFEAKFHACLRVAARASPPHLSMASDERHL